MRSRWVTGVFPSNSVMSAPAMKDFSPAPVITKTRTESSCFKFIERRDTLGMNRAVQRIQLFRPIYGKHRDSSPAFDRYGFIFRHIKKYDRRLACRIMKILNAAGAIPRCLPQYYRRRSRQQKAAASCPLIRRSLRRHVSSRSLLMTLTTVALTSTGTPSGRCDRMYRLSPWAIF